MVPASHVHKPGSYQRGSGNNAVKRGAPADFPAAGIKRHHLMAIRPHIHGLAVQRSTAKNGASQMVLPGNGSVRKIHGIKYPIGCANVHVGRVGYRMGVEGPLKRALPDHNSGAGV